MKKFTRFGIDVINEDGICTTFGYNLSKKEDFYYILCGLEIQDIRCYLDDMEENLASRKKTLIQNDNNAFNIFLSEDFSYANRIDERYPILLRSSVLISIYSLFEVSLVTICNFYSQKYSIPFKKVMRSELLNAKNFIEKEINVPFPDLEWELISHYRIIRNRLVHSKGYLFYSKGNIEKILIAIENLKEFGVTLENQNMIRLDETTCIHFINTVELFFQKMCRSFHFLD